MNKVLREALAEAETLSDEAQTALAEQLMRDVDLRRRIDTALEAAERTLREQAGIPLEAIKAEMRRRYGD
jgi:tRNA U54 and U55 pseudouridine synthase Pus10